MRSSGDDRNLEITVPSNIEEYVIEREPHEADKEYEASMAAFSANLHSRLGRIGPKVPRRRPSRSPSQKRDPVVAGGV